MHVDPITGLDLLVRLHTSTEPEHTDGLRLPVPCLSTETANDGLSPSAM